LQFCFRAQLGASADTDRLGGGKVLFVMALVVKDGSGPNVTPVVLFPSVFERVGAAPYLVKLSIEGEPFFFGAPVKVAAACYKVLRWWRGLRRRRRGWSCGRAGRWRVLRGASFHTGRHHRQRRAGHELKVLVEPWWRVCGKPRHAELIAPGARQGLHCDSAALEAGVRAERESGAGAGGVAGREEREPGAVGKAASVDSDFGGVPGRHAWRLHQDLGKRRDARRRW